MPVPLVERDAAKSALPAKHIVEMAPLPPPGAECYSELPPNFAGSHSCAVIFASIPPITSIFIDSAQWLVAPHSDAGTYTPSRSPAVLRLVLRRRRGPTRRRIPLTLRPIDQIRMHVHSSTSLLRLSTLDSMSSTTHSRLTSSCSIRVHSFQVGRWGSTFDTSPRPMTRFSARSRLTLMIVLRRSTTMPAVCQARARPLRAASTSVAKHCSRSAAALLHWVTPRI